MPARIWQHIVSLILIFSTGYIFGQYPQVTSYTVAGNYTFTVPCGVTQITVHVIGGGGGGGGSNTNGQAGGGGGAGGYASWTFGVVAGTSYPVQVGYGGFGGGPAGGGQNGQQSLWDGGVLFAKGGAGGDAANAGGAGGAGNVASGWAINITGGNGANGAATFGGGGGNAGGPYGGGGGAGGGGGVNGGPGGPYGAGGGGGGKKQGGNNTSGGQASDGAVIIEYDTPYPAPDAGGPYPVTCNATTLQANTPGAGWTATWDIVSGAPIIAPPNDPNATLTIPAPGTCVTVAWTFTQAGCTTMADTVVICYPLLCNDEPCGGVDVPLTVNSGSCSPTTYSNIQATGSVGMVEPGCGTYTDNDAWYAVTVPPSGTVTVQATDAAGGANMTMGISIYSEGANCLDVYHEGCDEASSSADIAELSYSGTPGETIYVRIWELNALEGLYDICAFETASPPGNVLPGNTTVNCGSTMTFFDPGGDGSNYQNNSTTTYVLCPDTPGQYVTVDFSTGPLFFNTEPAQTGTNPMGDVLTVLDGAADSSYIIGQYSGSVNPLIITSSAPDGCLTFIFSSDNAVTATGWEAEVSCSATAGVNDSTCTGTDCTGECGTWICETGLYPTENIGNESEDMTIGSGGCFDELGEVASQWFYFTALTSGNVEFSFAGPGGQDYNFAIYGPTTNGVPPCPETTGNSPVICSQADVGNYILGGLTGLSSTIGDGGMYEGPEGDGWLDPLQVVAGETYSMVVNIYQNGGPQPVIDMTIGGTGQLDCTPVFLPIELTSFSGINQGNQNLLSWVTHSEWNNDYFTIERSINGFDWEFVGEVDGAGNSVRKLYYSLIDDNPYFPVTYYRLSQTDFDGTMTRHDVIAVNSEKSWKADFVSALFPNPTSTYATFVYNGVDTENPLKVSLINEFGEVVAYEEFGTLYKGMPMTLRTETVPSGMYQVLFEQAQERDVQRLTIIK